MFHWTQKRQSIIKVLQYHTFSNNKKALQPQSTGLESFILASIMFIVTDQPQQQRPSKI